MKILIIRLDRIGDVLLSTPVIKALRDKYPDAHIAMMVRSYCRDIVEGNPNLDEVILYDKKDTLRLILRLRKAQFDLALVLHATNRSNVIPFLAGIPQRVGYDRKWGFLLTKRLKDTKREGQKHELEYTLDILREIGIEPKDRKLYMPVDRTAGKSFLERNGINEGGPFITIHPDASCPSKRWPRERFFEVAKRLSSTYNMKVVVIAAGEIRDLPPGFIGAFALPLPQVAYILEQSRLFITNDSGPVHIACAVGRPVVDIFGRNEAGLSPMRWGPSGPRDIVIHKDVGCEECLAHLCERGFACLTAITVDEVLEAAKGILEA